MELPPNRTRFTAQELVAALRRAYCVQLGHSPTQRTVCVLAAQAALETANGQSCVQWNIGNFKAAIGQDYCNFPTTEFVNGSPVRMICSFAVYRSLEDGCEKYIHDMYTRWTDAWPFAVAGDPEGFARGLHSQKPYPYYTAPVDSYISGMLIWFRNYMKMPWEDDDPNDTAQNLPFILPDLEDSKD